MALVKFGAGVSEMRGKEGGVIYSRNAYGSYIKTKVSPVNPQTGNQQTQRSLMGNLSQAWSVLTAGEKAAWDNIGAQVTRVNRFGDSTTYTGFSLFMRLNRNLSACGVSAITTAPSVPTISDLKITSFACQQTAPTMDLVFTPTPLGAGEYLVVYATPNIMTGRRFVKNFYRLVSKATGSVTSPIDFYSAWSAYYSTTLVAGASIFVKAKIIDGATGFDSVPDVISAVVGA